MPQTEVTVEGCIAQARAIAPQAPLVALIEWKVALERNHVHLLTGETGDQTKSHGQEIKQTRACLVRAIAQLLQS